MDSFLMVNVMVNLIANLMVHD